MVSVFDSILNLPIFWFEKVIRLKSTSMPVCEGFIQTDINILHIQNDPNSSYENKIPDNNPYDPIFGFWNLLFI